MCVCVWLCCRRCSLADSFAPLSRRCFGMADGMKPTKTPRDDTSATNHHAQGVRLRLEVGETSRPAGHSLIASGPRPLVATPSNREYGLSLGDAILCETSVWLRFEVGVNFVSAVRAGRSA